MTSSHEWKERDPIFESVTVFDFFSQKIYCGGNNTAFDVAFLEQLSNLGTVRKKSADK